MSAYEDPRLISVVISVICWTQRRMCDYRNYVLAPDVLLQATKLLFEKTEFASVVNGFGAVR